MDGDGQLANPTSEGSVTHCSRREELRQSPLLAAIVQISGKLYLEGILSMCIYGHPALEMSALRIQSHVHLLSQYVRLFEGMWQPSNPQSLPQQQSHSEAYFRLSRIYMLLFH